MNNNNVKNLSRRNYEYPSIKNKAYPINNNINNINNYSFNEDYDLRTNNNNYINRNNYNNNNYNNINYNSKLNNNINNNYNIDDDHSDNDNDSDRIQNESPFNFNNNNNNYNNFNNNNYNFNNNYNNRNIDSYSNTDNIISLDEENIINTRNLNNLNRNININDSTSNSIQSSLISIRDSIYVSKSGDKDKLEEIPEININSTIELKKLKTKNCTICLEDYKVNDKLIFLPCFHLFHKDCIVNWVKRDSTCPLCKTNINDNIK
jgi:hypothetical protein